VSQQPDFVLLKNLGSRNSVGDYSAIEEILIAGPIFFRFSGVLLSINLHTHRGLWAIKIEDVRANRNLPTKSKARPVAAKELPNDLLRD